MSAEEIISNIHESLAACSHPRFFETERGFQGQLLVELSKRILLPDQAIIEQEYQKRLEVHGLRIRPDIIIHEPYDPIRHPSRTDGNMVVVELKLNANAMQAKEDFESLETMLEVLHYDLGCFINIGSTDTHIAQIPRRMKERIISFAVTYTEGRNDVFLN